MTTSDLESSYQKNNFAEIINKWESLKLSPEQDPPSAYIAAASYFQLGRMQECSLICSTIDGFYSQDINFLSMYAACLRRQGLLQQSENFFLKALELDPQSIIVKNNYSNLLIDQGKLDKAKLILTSILEKNPDYTEARNNLENVKRLLDSKIKTTSPSKIDTKNEIVSEFEFTDPILDAFELNEAIQCGAIEARTNEDVTKLLGVISKDDIEQAESDLIKFANSQVIAKQYNGAIESITKLSQRRGIIGSTYQIASDAYIGLKNFTKAEIMALHALQFGEYNINLLINLGNLSAMRKDFKACKYWLDQASKLDQHDVNLTRAINLFFPNGHQRDQDNPFR